MNNKGFAISSVLYGLAIMGMMLVFIIVGTISTTRRSVVEQAEYVEDMINHLSKTTGVYNTNGTFTVPKGESGWYRVEAFGKNNGSFHGSYTTGIIKMKEGSKYSIHIGNDYSGITFVETGDIVMKAGAATATSPGGGLSCYSDPVNGAQLTTEDDLAENTTIKGIDSITFMQIGCNLSEVRGYLTYSDIGSDSIEIQAPYFLDSLILPGASGVDEGRVIIYKINQKTKNNRKLTSNYYTRIRASNSSPESLNGLYFYIVRTSINPDKIVLQKINTMSGYTINSNDGVSTLGDNKESIIVVSTEPRKSTKGLKIEMKKSSNWETLYDGNQYIRNYGDTGIQISSYQPDQASGADYAMGHGNYYLIPVDMDNRVLTPSYSDGSYVTASFITGDTKQIWSIDKVKDVTSGITAGDNEYRIMELSQYKALNVEGNENYFGIPIASSSAFNGMSRNPSQIWNIKPLKDGTVAIKTSIGSTNQSARSGFLYVKPTDGGVYDGGVYIGKAKEGATSDENAEPKDVERFYAYYLG